MRNHHDNTCCFCGRDLGAAHGMYMGLPICGRSCPAMDLDGAELDGGARFHAELEAALLDSIEACDDLTEIASFDAEARPDFPVIVGVMP